MRFTAALTAFAAALASATNTVTFENQDETTRTIYFTASEGLAAVDSVEIEGYGSQTVEIPTGWIGNWYSVSEGAENVPGMLGEVTFQGWNDLTYFDVSAIVNAEDTNGVKMIYPTSELESKTTMTKFSGCLVFPCNTAYYLWDDVQTVTTTETDLVCTLGTSNATTTKREAPGSLVARNFVLGKL